MAYSTPSRAVTGAAAVFAGKVGIRPQWAIDGVGGAGDGVEHRHHRRPRVQINAARVSEVRANGIWETEEERHI